MDSGKFGPVQGHYHSITGMPIDILFRPLLMQQIDRYTYRRIAVSGIHVFRNLETTKRKKYKVVK